MQQQSNARAPREDKEHMHKAVRGGCRWGAGVGEKKESARKGSPGDGRAHAVNFEEVELVNSSPSEPLGQVDRRRTVDANERRAHVQSCRRPRPRVDSTATVVLPYPSPSILHWECVVVRVGTREMAMGGGKVGVGGWGKNGTFTVFA